MATNKMKQYFMRVQNKKSMFIRENSRQEAIFFFKYEES